MSKTLQEVALKCGNIIKEDARKGLFGMAIKNALMPLSNIDVMWLNTIKNGNSYDGTEATFNQKVWAPLGLLIKYTMFYPELYLSIRNLFESYPQ